ncbi:MAG: oxygen-independent coproporphyrinogen III oxidase [Rhodospirillales bacterium]|jgi:oxygen-independent coproporphyrinogen III oxidase|nr:oxygen-independent coproporphyrinogen III oxidase [Rhodospirillales bacterium]
MQRDILAKYDRLVPRYTSYPTAPQFNEGVDGALYTDWLRNLSTDIPLSVYVHIPFCDTMCWFCGCNTKITNRYDPIEAYLDTLMQEIDLIAGILGPKRIANHIHWGGGSPTILKPEHLLKLANKLRENFELSPGAEFAVEIDPRGLEDSALGALAEGGITRASIGVQDVNPIVQKAVNRVQPVEITRHVIDTVRSLGITGINVDLMYGLPHQTVKGVERNVDTILEMEPDRLALFGYAHVPWMKSHMKKINKDVLPGRDERHDQMLAAAERLKANGYRWIGLDHFAKDTDSLSTTLEAGKLNRNFQGYTVDPCEALVGLGASSIGAHPNGYIQNHTPVRDWRRCIEDGVAPTAKGLTLTDDDRLRRAIIERLMCDLHVDVEVMCKRFDRAPQDFLDSFETLKPLQDDGLCAIDGWKVTIPEDARILMRTVAAPFDKYLAPDAKRHSRAV